MVVVMVVVAAVEVSITVFVSSRLHLIVQESHYYYTFLLTIIRQTKPRGLQEVIDNRIIQCQHIYLPYPYQYAVPFVPSEAPRKLESTVSKIGHL
jgi:hypothetical protein